MARKEVTDDFKIFSEHLSQLMKERGITQEVLADNLGIKRQTVSLYKKGLSTPDAAQLKNIALFFGVSADWLLGISHARTPSPDIQLICGKTGISETIVEEILQWGDNERDEFNKFFSNGIGGLLFSLNSLTRVTTKIDSVCSNDTEADTLLELEEVLKFMRFLAIDHITNIIDTAYRYDEFKEKLFEALLSKARGEHIAEKDQH